MNLIPDYEQHHEKNYSSPLSLVIRKTNFVECKQPWADPEGGQPWGVRTPLKNHKNIRFLSNTGPDPLKNHKATKPTFNVGPFISLPAKHHLSRDMRFPTMRFVLPAKAQISLRIRVV